MVQLVYASTAVEPTSIEDVGYLLIQARKRNLAKGVTGMLLYDYGRFLQVLEGPDDKVAEVFASIMRDPRHAQIMLISLNPIEAREFQYWSMAFLDLSTVAHLTTLPLRMNEVITGVDVAAKAKRYLRGFQGELHYRLSMKDESMLRVD